MVTHSPHITATADTLEVPGARLYHEVRGAGPLVALVGSPMGADSFAPLADLLAADHTVLTADPRGINRSPVHDPEQVSTPELRADDLARLIRHLDAGPAAVLGSSGGAVTALALVQADPETVHTVVAHEPPLDELLEEREELHRRTDAMIDTYLSGDRLGAWKQFLAIAGIDMPDEAIEQVFGGDPDPQTLADERRGFTREMRATTHWRPDLPVLRAAAPGVVVGIGEQSAGQLCDRTSRALAAELGCEPALFPGDHTGFAEDPEAFATRLRQVLAQA